MDGAAAIGPEVTYFQTRQISYVLLQGSAIIAGCWVKTVEDFAAWYCALY